MPKMYASYTKPKPWDLLWKTRKKPLTAMEAVMEGNVMLVKKMLRRRLADVNYCDQSGNTMMHVAVLADDLVMMRLLLKYKPNLNPACELKCSPIWLAALMGNEDAVAVLVLAGADLNEPLKFQYTWKDMCRHRQGMTLLHLFIQQQVVCIVRLLIDKGADINAVDQKQMTPLHTALEYRNAEIAKILLEKGASIDVPNIDGEAILHSALYLGNKEVISIIMNLNPDIKHIDNCGRNALHFVSQSIKENEEIAEYLLKQGVEVNKPAATYCVMPLHTALMSRKLNLIKLYIQYGADVNACVRTGYSAVYLAAISSCAWVMRMLLRNGANPNILTEYGDTALHRVCRHDMTEKMEVLLEFGADVNIKGERGLTPIENLRYTDRKSGKAFVKHIVKLESFNLFVDERVRKYIQDKPSLKLFREECLLEIEALKEAKFYCNYSLYYVLLNDTDKLYKLTRNKEFTVNFRSFRIRSNFPWYAEDIISIFNKAEQKGMDYNQLTEHLSLVFYRKYDCILEHIVKYLKPTDLPLTLA